MTRTYRLLPQNVPGHVQAVYYVEKNIGIPFAPTNRDYQEYLAWLAEGNEPLPADEPAE